MDPRGEDAAKVPDEGIQAESDELQTKDLGKVVPMGAIIPPQMGAPGSTAVAGALYASESAKDFGDDDVSEAPED